MRKRKQSGSRGGNNPDVKMVREVYVYGDRQALVGSLVLVYALTKAATSWMAENVVGDEHTYWGRALVVEWRYVEDLIAGMKRDGLVIVFRTINARKGKAA